MEEYVCWRKTLQANRDLPFPYLETYRKNDIFKKTAPPCVCVRARARVYGCRHLMSWIYSTDLNIYLRQRQVFHPCGVSTSYVHGAGARCPAGAPISPPPTRWSTGDTSTAPSD